MKVNSLRSFLAAFLIAGCFGFLSHHAKATNPYGQPIPFKQSAATESGHILCTAPCVAYSITATVNAAVAGYVLFFDSVTVPDDGAVLPVGCFAMPTGPISVAIPEIAYPRTTTTGFSVAYSSTGCFTKTASSNAYFSWQVMQ